MDNRLFFPATARNRGSIAEVLKRILSIRKSVNSDDLPNVYLFNGDIITFQEWYISDIYLLKQE